MGFHLVYAFSLYMNIMFYKMRSHEDARVQRKPLQLKACFSRNKELAMNFDRSIIPLFKNIYIFCDKSSVSLNTSSPPHRLC